MSTGSASAFLLWAILSCVFLALLILHLWLYDRLACLRWDSGRQPGAFKRIMTYSYLGTLPTLIAFSVAMTAIKYMEGYVMLPNGQIIPRPFDNYNPSNRRWLLPLFFTLSVSWSLELVTHLEELTFWLFLLHQGPGKRDWFHCWEFRTWYLGSCAAVLGMPLTVLITRDHLDSCLGYIFLVGSSAGVTTTVCFLYVIFRFPAFLEYVKAGGADPDVIVRLATFYELNCIRVVFRFIFSVPLLIIAMDALRGPYPIISNPFALDFLLMCAGIGSFISSGITLLIFFPRSITHESGYRVKIMSPQTSAKPPSIVAPEYFHDHHHGYHFHDPSNPISVLDGPATPASTAYRMHAFRFPHGPADGGRAGQYLDPTAPVRNRRDSVDTGSDISLAYDSDGEVVPMPAGPCRRGGSPLPPPHPIPHHRQSHPMQHSQSHPGHRRRGSISNAGTKSDDTMWEDVSGGGGHSQLDSSMTSSPTLRRHYSDGPSMYKRGKMSRIEATQSEVHEATGPIRTRQERRESQLHPYLLHFTSPIDLMDPPYYESQDRSADV